MRSVIPARWILLALVSGVAAVLAFGLQRCYTPPAIQPVGDRRWKLEESKFPSDTSAVSIEVEPGVFLRGIHVPSDAGAPLIVHFQPSGSSVTRSSPMQSQYRELSQRGYASLVVDYRGVGLCDGEVSPGHVAADAAACYAHALELVGGREDRLLLRGTSVGSLAIGSLIEQGRRPAGIVLFAPVLGESVAVRFGYAKYSKLLVTLARPFLYSVTDVDLVEALRRCPSPLLVFGSVDDELLSEAEWDAITAAVEEAGGTVATSAFTDFPRFEDGGLRFHVGVSAASVMLQAEEQDWLRQRFPAVPPLDARVAALRAAASPEALAALAAEADAADRLRALALLRHEPADVLLAAVLEIQDVAEAEILLDDDLLEVLPEVKNPCRGRTFEELRWLLRLEDPSGPLPLRAIMLCRTVLLRHELDQEATTRADWPVEDLVALARTLEGESDGARILAPTAAGPAVPPRRRLFQLPDPGQLVIHTSEGASATLLEALRVALAGEEVFGPAERHRRLIRVLLKGAGYADRVVTGPDGAAALEFLDGGVWTRLDQSAWKPKAE
jgi:alpha/beta superfamily hydrolase